APAEPDAPALKAKARTALTRAADRAASLASAGEAARYFAQAAELAEEPLERAELLERSGRAATQDGDLEQANEALQEAIDLLEARGERHAAARVSARLAQALRVADRIDEAFALMVRIRGTLRRRTRRGRCARGGAAGTARVLRRRTRA